MNPYEKLAANGSDSTEAENAGRQGSDWTGDWFPRLYGELRALARAQRRRYRSPNSPGTTSIVHEAYERLNASPGAGPDNPLHFYRTNHMESHEESHRITCNHMDIYGRLPPVKPVFALFRLIRAERACLPICGRSLVQIVAMREEGLLTYIRALHGALLFSSGPT